EDRPAEAAHQGVRTLGRRHLRDPAGEAPRAARVPLPRHARDVVAPAPGGWRGRRGGVPPVGVAGGPLPRASLRSAAGPFGGGTGLPHAAPGESGGGGAGAAAEGPPLRGPAAGLDRKSTRLNSSHVKISYAVFCLKKKT